MRLFKETEPNAICGILSSVAPSPYTLVMHLRLRIPELLIERKMTPYALAKQSDGRVSPTSAYRLVRRRGRLRYYDSRLLETLCDLLEVSPGELFAITRSE